ncbi:hypothetical protein EYF80_018571 [Liparis tanakae]|uniref:Uncharacterized protein n=1 Tax=Liparis tanakae TaxID=230148 RepID=A0A4Z2I1V3_9TELE|nr:hypothetical protein EYF80_018571 [Liparis tanakae]
MDQSPIVNGVPLFTFKLPRRTTSLFNECSDKLICFVFASALMERLKCADPRTGHRPNSLRPPSEQRSLDSGRGQESPLWGAGR